MCLFVSEGVYNNNKSNRSIARSFPRVDPLQIYEEITNTMYNERRLELLEGPGELATAVYVRNS